MMKAESESEVAQSGPTLCNPMDCSLPGSSVHGSFQARLLEWGAISKQTDKPLLVRAYATVLRSFRVRCPPPPPPAAPVQRAPQSRRFPRETGGWAEERRARARALIQPTTQLLQEDIGWQRWSPWGGPAPHLCTFFLPEVHQTKTSSSWSQLNHWI